MPGKTVLSIVANGGTTDARVMKQARALRDGGYQVWLLANAGENLPASEHVDGIEIRRIDFSSHTDISLESIEQLGRLTPHVASKVTQHAESLLNWKPLLEATRQQRLTAKKDYALARECRKQCKAERASLRAALGPTAFVLGKLFSKYFLRPPAASFFNHFSFVREPAFAWQKYKTLKKCEQEKEVRANYLSHQMKILLVKLREFHLSSAKVDDIFFTRVFIYASNIMKYDLEINPDIIHCHDIYPLLGGVALAKRHGARLIFDAHEIETERVPPLPPERKKFVDQLERDLILKTDQLITVCNSAKDFYFERFRKRMPAVVMNAPEDVSQQEHSEFDIRASAGLTNDTHTVIYTGGVAREARGLDKVVSALAYLPENVHLVVLGPRHKLNDPWLLECATNAGTRSRVHLLPPVPPEKVVGAIRSADVGICPIQDVSLSYRYAMPNKLFEVAFAGVPICVSNLPEMSKFVSELGIGVIMDETKPDSIAGSIAFVLKNKGRFALTDAAKQILQEKYCWPRQAEKLLQAYGELEGANVNTENRVQL